ncbi:MAG TPA: chromate resistance protein ChrB domain-containing protein [Candidatus Dormibacteraeota bacterium]|nr:chromate resistance protein ChrB domain-containing protein [Candidatus Dormibacteraeota bacterium]
MRWATRSGYHVDRAARAWLIRPFLDSEATFLFVDDPDDVPEEVTPFDMPSAELSHHRSSCSFETMLSHFGLDDPVLWDLARIVHESDLADDAYDAPVAPGLDVVIRGLSIIFDDEQVSALAGPIFDGLYEYRRRVHLTGWQDPA